MRKGLISLDLNSDSLHGKDWGTQEDGEALGSYPKLREQQYRSLFRASRTGGSVSDTASEATTHQTKAYCRLTGVERLSLAFDMSLLARDLCRTRLRLQHPDWTDDEVKRELLRYAFASTALPPPLR